MDVSCGFDVSQGASRKRAAGFTLIELIVVIGVIAILIAILFPAVSGMRERARAREAEVTQKALENAIRAYRAEYGCWPGPNPDVTCVYTHAAQVNIIRYLLSTSTGENPHKIPFWETSGVVTNISTKQPFSITIDVNNNTVTVQ
jgi:prepilin-type N-terminal cleavage/methylation domain-containing protein